jgi:hypothetical protein
MADSYVIVRFADGSVEIVLSSWLVDEGTQTFCYFPSDVTIQGVYEGLLGKKTKYGDRKYKWEKHKCSHVGKPKFFGELLRKEDKIPLKITRFSISIGQLLHAKNQLKKLESLSDDDDVSLSSEAGPVDLGRGQRTKKTKRKSPERAQTSSAFKRKKKHSSATVQSGPPPAPPGFESTPSENELEQVPDDLNLDYFGKCGAIHL